MAAKEKMRSTRSWLALASGLSLFALVNAPVSAAFLTDMNGNGALDVGDAILTPGGFTVGDKLFSNFVYVPTGTNPTEPVGGPPSGGPPRADQVAITALTAGGNYGLRFGFGWYAINGLNMDSRIDYKITVTDPDPTRLIDKVKLTFNGVSLNTAIATVAESVFTTGGTLLGTLFVHSDPDGGGAAQGLHSSTYDIPVNQKSILVSKDIQVFAAPVFGASPTNFATISFVDNTYVQTVVIPEPAGLACLSLSAVGLLVRRRRGQEMRRCMPNCAGVRLM